MGANPPRFRVRLFFVAGASPRICSSRLLSTFSSDGSGSLFSEPFDLRPNFRAPDCVRTQERHRRPWRCRTRRGAQASRRPPVAFGRFCTGSSWRGAWPWPRCAPWGTCWHSSSRSTARSPCRPCTSHRCTCCRAARRREPPLARLLRFLLPPLPRRPRPRPPLAPETLTGRC